MADSLERIIAQSGKVFGIAANTTDLVNEAIKRHDLGPTAAAALGRAMTGAVLLAALLKDKQNVRLIFEGNGPLGKVIAEAGSQGWCRGYVSQPQADVPLKNGAVDVAGGIGLAGFLHVIKDIDMKEKYTGLVQLYTSQIGDDIAYYLAESEQTPSTVALGVYLQPDGTASAAGGFLIQSLPPADEKMIEEIERNIQGQEPITSLISRGVSPAEILSTMFWDIEYKQTGSSRLSFRCTCTKKQMEEVLYTLSKQDITYLLEQEEDVEMKCDFCSTRYVFDRTFLITLATKNKDT